MMLAFFVSLVGAAVIAGLTLAAPTSPAPRPLASGRASLASPRG